MHRDKGYTIPAGRCVCYDDDQLINRSVGINNCSRHYCILQFYLHVTQNFRTGWTAKLG